MRGRLVNPAGHASTAGPAGMPTLGDVLDRFRDVPVDSGQSELGTWKNGCACQRLVCAGPLGVRGGRE